MCMPIYSAAVAINELIVSSTAAGKSEVRSQKPEVRSQKSEARSQKSKVKSQKSKVFQCIKRALPKWERLIDQAVNTQENCLTHGYRFTSCQDQREVVSIRCMHRLDT